MFHPQLRRLLALLIVLLICVAMLFVQRQHRAMQARKATGPAALISPELMAQFTAIENRERQVDETTWAPERRAEQCSSVFDGLWDDLNRATNKFDVLQAFPIGELLVAKYDAPQILSHSIERRP